jgi:hypothetical protein
MAAALKGFEKSSEGVGCRASIGTVPEGYARAGVTSGELKQSRYNAMKNSSFAAQAMNSTF